MTLKRKIKNNLDIWMHSIKFFYLNSIISYLPSRRLRIFLIRLIGAKIGKISMGRGFEIRDPKRLIIEDGCAIGPRVRLDARKGLIIKSNVTIAEEAMTYGIPTFKLNGNLVHFAAFKKHIGFYPTPTAIEKFSKELSEYNISKGTVRFPLDKPIPYSLIKEIVRFRIEENMQ